MAEKKNIARELGELLFAAGATVQIGLRAQGHIPTIERMLSEGATWGEIGKAIGWCPETAWRWYQYELAEPKPAEEPTP